MSYISYVQLLAFYKAIIAHHRGVQAIAALCTTCERFLFKFLHNAHVGLAFFGNFLET